ncbi:GreA/GreB family elongation factor [Vibrio metschnikovii]|nr:GreA/GreB family elongation factor [Vibrio metschnikovii]
MLYRFYRSWLQTLRMWWLTSGFITYQSPLLLIQLFERQEQQNTPHCPRATSIRLGDTVHLLDVATNSPFKIKLVADHRCDHTVGYIAVDSYLGAALFGRTEQEVISLLLLGQRHSFVITQVIRQSYQPRRTSVPCGCLLCQ